MRILSLFLLSGIALTGCHTPASTFIPAGYTYHQENYKSPPGPKAKYLEAQDGERSTATQDALYND